MSLNLFDMGLRFNWQEAIEGLRNARFVVLTLMWGYVLCPGLYLQTELSCWSVVCSWYDFGCDGARGR
jgi:hypothetical protein